MSPDIPYIFFYTANLAFILTNVYGWLLSVFYKPLIYKSRIDRLYPSRYSNASLYLLQLFEIPYLLMIGDPEALFYVNTFSLLIFPALMYIMSREFFFLKRKNRIQHLVYFLPVILISSYLLLVALDLIVVNRTMYDITYWIIIAVFVCYIIKISGVQLDIRKRIRCENEQKYSNREDFPVKYAKMIMWLPGAISTMMLLNFVLGDFWIKMWRDILFTVVNVWFMIHTLTPKRVVRIRREKETLVANENSKFRLSLERSIELERRIVEMVETERLYLDDHLTSAAISDRLRVNRNYISEAIGRSKYGSFYNMINQYRIEHACQMLSREPDLKIGYVALESGFSSSSLFTQTFKRYKGVLPSQYAKQHSLSVK